MTIFRIIDVETTGLEDKSKVVEIASLDLNEVFSPSGRFRRTFVNPQIPIPPEVSAIHHITDEMVKDAPLMGAVMDDFRGADFYVAHNSRFDQKFLGTFDKPWIDTYRCALIAWPDANSHSNQALSYQLKVERPPESAGHAHRALYDCYVTARLLPLIAEKMSLDAMLHASNEPATLKKVGFGKHFGELYADLPYGYLKWMVGQDFNEDVLHTVRAVIKSRGYKNRG